MKVWFIDDCFTNKNTSREQKIELLEQKGDVQITKILPSQISNLRDSSDKDIDLIFIDFKLDADNGIFSVGSEVVSLVRALVPDTPLYLLSVETNDSEEYERVEGFERRVGENYLSHPDKVKSDIKDHALLKYAITTKNTSLLMRDLFRAPDDVKEDLDLSLPGTVRKFLMTENSSEGTLGPRVEFFRWFIDLFYQHPGFLLSEDACAMYLGISVEYFRTISHQFKDCLYEGVFFNTLLPRWWKSKIEDLIIAKDENGLLNINSFNEASSKILMAQEEHLARCVVCRDYWPDSLALVEGSNRSLHMVHIGCSEPDVDFNVGPYFQKPRMIKT